MTRERNAGAAPIRRAVLPAAGWGTRFLPATKAQPKEMLPLIDKPLIQYAVEEAVDSGIRHVTIVTGRGKDAIEGHFDVSGELETVLAERGRTDPLEEIRRISNMARVTYVRQRQALGLGHAIACARDAVGEDPFAVVLGDDVIDADVPCLAQMMAAYRALGCSIVAASEVPPSEVSRYGIVREGPADADDPRRARVEDVVEKPSPTEAPSNLAIIGRYILTPGIFAALEETPPGRGGEIQLTDAIRRLIETEPVYAYRFEGARYDAGDKLGFLKGTIELALKRDDLGAEFREYLESLKL